MKNLANQLITVTGLTLGLMVRVHPAIAIIIGTYEAVGVQSSQVSGITTENFDTDNTAIAKQATGVTFTTARTSNIGTYDQGYIQVADQYGGAGGTGNYLLIGYKSTSLSTTITLNSPQRYFGLWWSAGDSNNALAFYSGSRVIGRITTADMTNLISSTGSSYKGNPTTKYSGQDANEPFAYLNFFANPNDQTETFNKIVLTNTSTTGFESDNHSVAATYSSTRGTQFAQEGPFEPSFGLGLVAFGILLFGNRLSRGIMALIKPLRSAILK